MCFGKAVFAWPLRASRSNKRLFFQNLTKISRAKNRMRGSSSQNGLSKTHKIVFFSQNQVFSKKKKVFTEIERVFLSKFRWSPKRERSSCRLRRSFSDPLHLRFFTKSHSNYLRGGGAIFVFSAKISLKSAKSTVFCILFWPMEKA